MPDNPNRNSDKGYLDHFDLSQKEIEAIALSQEQEAEHLLYRYIVTSACKSETPLNITRRMASYLGFPQKLPSGRILEAATADGSTDLAAQQKILTKALEEAGLDFKDLNILELDVIAGENNWISIHAPEITAEESLKNLEKEKWREPDLLPPKLRADGKKVRPRRFAMMVVIALILFAVVKGESCSPAKLIRGLQANIENTVSAGLQR